MVAGAGRGKGNAKSYNPRGPGYSSDTGYFSRFSDEEVVQKIFGYIARHPQFEAELELLILEEEHPELVQRDIGYLMRKSIGGPKNLSDHDLDYMTKEIADRFLFKGKQKRNVLEKTAEGSLKLLLKNYLSDMV